MVRMNFQYSCVSPKDIEELNHIIDNSREVTYKTFRKYVETESFNNIKEGLGYTKQLYNDCGLTIENDYAVSFHKSKTIEGKPVYYLRHSAIEYIFY